MHLGLVAAGCRSLDHPHLLQIMGEVVAAGVEVRPACPEEGVAAAEEEEVRPRSCSLGEGVVVVVVHPHPYSSGEGVVEVVVVHLHPYSLGEVVEEGARAV